MAVKHIDEPPDAAQPDAALIAAHIEPHPRYAGEGDVRLKIVDGGVPVWAMTENGENADLVASDYGVARAAVAAAWAYYQQHREAIDRRLAENDEA